MLTLHLRVQKGPRFFTWVGSPLYGDGSSMRYDVAYKDIGRGFLRKPLIDLCILRLSLQGYRVRAMGRSDLSGSKTLTLIPTYITRLTRCPADNGLADYYACRFSMHPHAAVTARLPG
jgi:hypothetical protein